MPRMDAAIYAAHMDNVLKLARREGGVSRPQIIKELNITRAVANGLIEKAALELDRTEGRTDFFKAPDGIKPPETDPTKPEVKQSKPETAAQAAATPSSDDTGQTDDKLAELAALDEQIFETREALVKAAKAAGEALGEYATKQALVDAMRQQMQELVARRMRISF